MRQLLQNLVSNGIKFRREGVPPVVRSTGEVKGDVAEIEVSDNGIGFDPRYAARIFRVFERLHGRDDYPGTGIGLALCRRIAERHGRHHHRREHARRRLDVHRHAAARAGRTTAPAGRLIH